MEGQSKLNQNGNISRYSTGHTLSQINSQHNPTNNDNRANNQNNYNYVPSVFDLMNQMNNMNKVISQMGNHIKMNDFTINNMKSNMIIMEREKDKMKSNMTIMEREKDKMKSNMIIMEREKDKMKSNMIIMERERERMKSDIKIMKEGQLKLGKENCQMKIKIELLNQEIKSVNNNIMDRLDNIELNIKELHENIILNNQEDCYQYNQINKILDILNKIIENADAMKIYFNGKMKENEKEKKILITEIEKLKQRIKELQNIIVGRKIIKLLIKVIILNCFNSYTIIKDNKKYHIGNVQLKDRKYKGMIVVVNNLIDTIFKANKIIHMEGSINKIIDIVNSHTTYGDLIDICEKILTQNDLKKIKKLFDEKIISVKKWLSGINRGRYRIKKNFERINI